MILELRVVDRVERFNIESDGFACEDLCRHGKLKGS